MCSGELGCCRAVGRGKRGTEVFQSYYFRTWGWGTSPNRCYVTSCVGLMVTKFKDMSFSLGAVSGIIKMRPFSTQCRAINNNEDVNALEPR